MIKPLPLSSFAIETLLPGEDSWSSTSGIASPAFTNAGTEAWKEARCEALRRAGRAEKVRRVANMFKSRFAFFAVLTYNVVQQRGLARSVEARGFLFRF